MIVLSVTIMAAVVLGGVLVGMSKKLPEITPDALQQICNNI